MGYSKVVYFIAYALPPRLLHKTRESVQGNRLKAMLIRLGHEF